MVFKETMGEIYPFLYTINITSEMMIMIVPEMVCKKGDVSNEEDHAADAPAPADDCLRTDDS